MVKNKKIGLCYLGCGFFGLQVLERYFTIKNLAIKKGIEVVLYAVVDTDEKVRKELENNLKTFAKWKLLPSLPKIYKNFDSLIKELIEKHPEYKIIVYDATPTQFHFENLGSVLRFQKDFPNRIYYFGEKPCLIENEQLTALLNASTIWCDFVELQSECFLKISEFLNVHPKFQIKKLRFWRLSSMGFKKIFQQKRFGVTGGALEDKMVHDLALTVGILSEGVNKIAEAPEDNHEIISAIIPYFMPANVYSIIGNLPLFMTVQGKIIDAVDLNSWLWPKRISDPTADAVFSLKMRWRLNEPQNKTKNKDKKGNWIDAEYYTSWAGVSDFPTLYSVIDNIKEKWIDKYFEVIEKERDDPIISSDIGYIFEEARVCIIEGEENKKHLTIYCNFLNRPKYGIKPSVWILYENREKEPLELQLNSDITSIDRIFLKVIEDCLNETNGPFLTNHTIYLVHKILLKAREKAFQKFYDTALEAEKSNKRFSKLQMM